MFYGLMGLNEKKLKYFCFVSLLLREAQLDISTMSVSDEESCPKQNS
jgi:hypothetical protein